VAQVARHEWLLHLVDGLVCLQSSAHSWQLSVVNTLSAFG
jgi:hypothetical protein